MPSLKSSRRQPGDTFNLAARDRVLQQLYLHRCQILILQNGRQIDDTVGADGRSEPASASGQPALPSQSVRIAISATMRSICIALHKAGYGDSLPLPFDRGRELVIRRDGNAAMERIGFACWQHGAAIACVDCIIRLGRQTDHGGRGGDVTSVGIGRLVRICGRARDRRVRPVRLVTRQTGPTQH